MTEGPFVNRLERSDDVSGPVVAERTFEFEGRPDALQVRLRQPHRDSDTDNYWCTLELIGTPETTRFKLWGVDSLQALQLAMRAAGELLREMGPAVTWHGETDLGIPRTYPSFLSAAACSRIAEFIDREVAQEAQSKNGDV